MEETRVPIYLITGFLESGKTSFLNFTLQQDYFQIDGKTLLILCEEGEEEYDAEALKQHNTDVVYFLLYQQYLYHAFQAECTDPGKGPYADAGGKRNYACQSAARHVP